MRKALITFFVLLLSTSTYSQTISDDSNSVSKIKNDILRQKGMVYNYLISGDNRKFKGDLVGAEHYYDSAKLIADSLIAVSASPRMVIFGSIYEPYDRLGHLYLLTNNLRKAESYFLEAQNKMRNLPRKSIFRVPPIVGLGEVYLAKNDFEKANLYFEEAENKFNAATTSFYSYEPIRRTILFNQFDVLLKVKNYKKAHKVIKALSTGGIFFGSHGIDNNSQIPMVFELKSRYYLEIGDIEQAEYYIHQAKYFANILSASLLQFKILKTETLINWTKGDYKSATTTINQLIEAYKVYILENFAFLSENEREAFYTGLRQDFDLANAFILSNIDHIKSDSMYAMAYDNQLFSKALLLNQINKLKNNILLSDDEDLKEKLKNWEISKTYLSTLYFQKIRNFKAIRSTELTIHKLERELNEKTSFLKNINNEIKWQQVQEKLVNGEAAIEIIRTKSFTLFGESDTDSKYHLTDSISYMILIITKQSINPTGIIISNGNELEGKYLNYYRNSIKFKKTDKVSYTKFWRPIKNHLDGLTKIYLSSDGVYNQINLNTLRNPANGKYLLDEIDIVFVTNTKDIVKKNVVSKVKNAILFGRPSYLLDSTYVRLDTKEIPVNNYTNRSLKSETFDSFREQKFSDLPATEYEIINIKRVLDEWNWKTVEYLGNEASETNLKLSINPSVLHIATHGFFLQEDVVSRSSSLIRSGIVLAGVSSVTSTIGDDGVLTAYEATNLTLDSTMLVVLSACETGLGVVKNGEGVYGLQRGFIVAGANYVLMSLWRVDDFATRFLMEAFYENWLSGIHIHDAIKQAQQELRKKYDHPYYWGAFILSGN